MKTRDEAIRDLAFDTINQAGALEAKMDQVITGLDEDDEPDEARLCGITRDRDGRSMLAFADPATRRQRTVVYVDAILALAKLLNGEVQVGDD